MRECVRDIGSLSSMVFSFLDLIRAGGLDWSGLQTGSWKLNRWMLLLIRSSRHPKYCPNWRLDMPGCCYYVQSQCVPLWRPDQVFLASIEQLAGMFFCFAGPISWLQCGESNVTWPEKALVSTAAPPNTADLSLSFSIGGLRADTSFDSRLPTDSSFVSLRCHTLQYIVHSIIF